MRRVIYFLAIVAIHAAHVAAVPAGSARTLVPAPRMVRWSGDAPLNLTGKSVAIVVGARATEPEQYAAHRLAEQVQKRFGVMWPVVAESNPPADAAVRILLGQRTTHEQLDALCREKPIGLGEESPGFDGYVIRILQTDGKDIVVVGGCNARGVIYGQDTLFQLLGGTNDQVTLARASIDDRPMVPWRGRPQTSVAHYLRPGELDLLAAGRVNFVDLRNGTYAYEGGDKLEKDLISKVVKEAHRRGMIVYGTVNTGIPKASQDAVLGTFREMIALGVDGLWLSFDDKGPGEDAAGMTARTLELGRKHNMTGPLIAITPPKGAYQEILHSFNREIMAVAGMERALWFWTALPNARNAADAASIGIRCRPSWWHNWPRMEFSTTYRAVPAMVNGWHGPDDEILATLATTCEAVMPWGGNQMPQWYVAPISAWWAWNPSGHCFADVRGRIYSTVFGPSLTEKARDFDDALTRLQAMLRYSLGRPSPWQPLCPPRLRKVEDRPAAAELVAQLDRLLADIEKLAPRETMLDAAQLDSEYLQRMRDELAGNKASVELDFPEYWWPEHQRKLLTALYDRRSPLKPDEVIAAGRDRLIKEADQVGARLPDVRYIKEYVDSWTGLARLDVEGWRNRLAERRREFDERLVDYAYCCAKVNDMVAGISKPPLDWATGRWERTNRVLATVWPIGNEQFWGGWMGGSYEIGGHRVAAFAANRREPCDEGTYCELSASMLMPQCRRNQLAVMIHLANINKETIGGHYVPSRWGGHRFVTLKIGDQVVWEADVGPDRVNGEWFVARIPEVPEGALFLPVTLRVEDRLWSMNNNTLVLVGPIRLVELAEP